MLLCFLFFLCKSESWDDFADAEPDITVFEAFKKILGSLYYLFLRVYNALSVAFSPILTPVFNVINTLLSWVYKFFFVLFRAIAEALNMWHIALIQSIERVRSTFSRVFTFRSRPSKIITADQPHNSYQEQRESLLDGFAPNPPPVHDNEAENVVDDNAEDNENINVPPQTHEAIENVTSELPQTSTPEDSQNTTPENTHDANENSTPEADNEKENSEPNEEILDDDDIDDKNENDDDDAEDDNDSDDIDDDDDKSDETSDHSDD